MNRLAQSCSTFSKRYDQHVFNWPEYFYDDTTEEYFDTVCALGSNLIGYNNNFSCTHIEEVKLAEKILNIIPFCNRIKFLKTGSAACEAAIRIARAFTGRKKVFGHGYHGCSNVFIASELPGLGCIDEGYIKIDDIFDLCEAVDNDTAAVIIEPVQLEYSEERKSNISCMREKTKQTGSMLIFDEIITGFRVPDYFISNCWNIKPDIICGGKAIGNGYPLSFVAGKSEWMDKDYFISNTHNGELSSIKEALEIIKELSPKIIIDIWGIASEFMEEINKTIKKIDLKIVGYPTRGEWQGNIENHAKFCELMADEKILVGKAWFYNFSTTHRKRSNFIECSERSVNKIINGYKLRGYIPKPIFKRN